MAALLAWMILLLGITILCEVFYCIPVWIIRRVREWRKDREMRDILTPFYR